MTEVLKDRPFYEQSGGGVTLSGGEPMLQFEFTRAILAAARAQKLHTCLETSGFAPAQAFREILPLVDLFLYDCKETDAERHRTFTGQTNGLVLRNLRALDAAGARIILRCPLIPGYNLRDDHLAGIARLSQELAHCEAVHVLGYHRLGESKRERLGLGKDGSQGLGIPEPELNAAIEKLRSLGARNVCRS
jgi:pyruvate formate lyase activating enzyme